MWPHNALTERLGLDWPILSAPMTPFASPALAASVSNAGGLGGLGLTGFSLADATRRIATFRQQSGRSLNANLLIWPALGDLPEVDRSMRERLQGMYDLKGLGTLPELVGAGNEFGPEHLALFEAIRPEAVSFHFGLPCADMVQAIKALGAFVMSSATTVAEARALEAGGADAIIAQGTEAGGHRGTFSETDVSRQSGLISLLPQVVDAVGVPVIAAGGIVDGRSIAAAFMLGATGVQVGTAFLRCAEADISDAHRAALRDADDTNTRVTRLVTGRPARMIANQLTDTLGDLEAAALPFPAQSELTAPLAAGDDRDFLPLYASQSVALTRETSAADLMATLAEETERRLKAFAR